MSKCVVRILLGLELLVGIIGALMAIWAPGHIEIYAPHWWEQWGGECESTFVLCVLIWGSITFWTAVEVFVEC